jgi:hypothetical protein
MRQQNPWASEHRTIELMKILTSYGLAAKPVIPELQKIASELDKGEPDFPKHLSLQKAASVREAIRVIETSTNNLPLVPMP